MNNLASYGYYRSGGAPLVGKDGVLDMGKVERLARYGTVSIPANTLLLRPDIAPALRDAGAKRILFYTTVTHWWLKPDFVPAASDTSFFAEFHRVLLRTNGFVPGAPLGYEVDWDNAETAKGLTELFAKLAGSGMFDGAALDFCSPYWKAEGATAREEAMRRMVTALRDAGGHAFYVMANGIGADDLNADAVMREGFPQPFTSFDDALYHWGDLWLKGEDRNPRAGRFLYGTALLIGATAVWSPSTPSDFDGDHWLPEFDVDLGLPKGSYLKLTSGIYTRWFERGLVLVNPTWDVLDVDLLTKSHKELGFAPSRYVDVPAMDAVVMVRA